MNQQIEHFKQAELALAAYGDFASNVPTQRELEATEFSTKQAEAFISTYRVVDQHTDATGLSATVFADADNNTYLAIRGTEVDDPADLITGLVNILWLGSTALHPQYISLKAQVIEWLNNGTLSPTFTATGHSLGGYLAKGIATDFASNVSHAYLYNAPGLGGTTGTAISPILDFLGITTNFDPAKISNIEASEGISLVAGLGYQTTPPIDITIEDQMSSDVIDPPDARNHSQQVLTDALAVYSIYSQLLPPA